MKAIIVLPTYNEKDNIEKMINTILSLPEYIEVLVVDDNSPDGTATIVEKYLDNNRVHLLKREKKAGLGPAYIAGFKHSFQYDPDYVIEMDADFSHDPNFVIKFINRMEDEKLDLVIGSRYCNGISVVNWPLRRLFLSYYGNRYASFVLGSKIMDITGGFKCFRVSVLKNMKRDIHIMAYEPEKYFDRMDIGDGDIVSVHYESSDNIHDVLKLIKQRGASPFLAISPDTDADVLNDFRDEIDGVLVMTVYPGFAGQPIVEGSFDKISKVRNIIDSFDRNILLEVDGHVSWDLCRKMRSCGADIFVAGSSSVYSKGIDLDQAVKKMKELIK